MSNIFRTPEKLGMSKFLQSVALEALEEEGWSVAKSKKHGRRRVFVISRGNEEYLACVKTSQDAWFAFMLNEQHSWDTLQDVDKVIVASVEKKENPSKVNVHLMDAEVVRERFDQEIKPDSKPNHQGSWISLYGRGELGEQFPAIYTKPVPAFGTNDSDDMDLDSAGKKQQAESKSETMDAVILEAKNIVANALGVETSSINIVVQF